MLIEPLHTFLYVFDFTGTCVDLDVKNPEPIRKALEAEGGIITIKKYYYEPHNCNRYCLIYNTLCSKIKISIEITKENFEYHLDFFDKTEVVFTTPIKFGLDGNRFVLCDTE